MLGILLTPVWPSFIKELGGQKEIRKSMRERISLSQELKWFPLIYLSSIFSGPKQNKCVCIYLLCASSTSTPHFESQDQKRYFANRKASFMLHTTHGLNSLLMLLLLPCNSICVSDKDNYLFLTWTSP